MHTILERKRRSGGGRGRGFALIATIVYLTVILILGSCIIAQTIQELDTASRVKKHAAAFNLAEAGIDYAAWQLYNHQGVPGTWTNSIPGVGSYTVTASKYDGRADTLVLLSTSSYEGHPSQVKVIGAYLSPGATGENAVFDNALFSNADANFNGGLDVTGNAFANGNMTLKGNAHVAGDAGAANNVTVQGAATVDGTIRSKQPKMPMPVIDVQYYRNKATSILPGGSSLPTSINGVVVITGPLNVNGNATISGTGVIVVDGDVTLNGNCLLDVSSADDEFAIVTTGSVKVNGSATIHGWIYAHNLRADATFSGNGAATVTGGVVADVLGKCNGGLTVVYKQATVELPGAPAAPAQFAGISWREVR